MAVALSYPRCPSTTTFTQTSAGIYGSRYSTPLSSCRSCASQSTTWQSCASQATISQQAITRIASQTLLQSANSSRSQSVLQQRGGTDILCIGDSLTQGFVGGGETTLSPYTDRLQERLKSRGKSHMKVQNEGVTGEQTDIIRHRLETILKSKVFSWVVLLAGANDLGRRGTDEIFRNLTAMHAKARESKARIALMTIPASSRRPQCDERDRLELNQKLQAFAYANKDDTILIDVATALPQDVSHAHYWSSDTLHFSVKGYQVMGDVIAEKLLPYV